MVRWVLGTVSRFSRTERPVFCFPLCKKRCDAVSPPLAIEENERVKRRSRTLKGFGPVIAVAIVGPATKAGQVSDVASAMTKP